MFSSRNFIEFPKYGRQITVKFQFYDVCHTKNKSLHRHIVSDLSTNFHIEPNLLKSFNPITLEEMDSVKLLNRTDTKFLLNQNQFQTILKEIQPHYSVLQINDKRISSYETLYYDTKELALFTAHQNGKLNRRKIRFRKYVDSNLHFLEIKFKSNKGRTFKTRTKCGSIEQKLSANSTEFITKNSNVNPASLVPQIRNNFDRITFVNLKAKERLTFDFNLHFVLNSKRVQAQNLVVAELKRDKASGASSFLSIAQANRVAPNRISKYCIGTVLLLDSVKYNNFKPKIRTINKITHGNH